MTSRVAQRAAQRAHKRIVLELQNRTGMLCVHGGLLLVVGLLMASTGAPGPIEEWFGPWSRLIVGGAAMGAGAGVLLGVALTDEDRLGWIATLVGMIGAAFWHLSICSAYAWAAVTTRMELLSPGEILSIDMTNRGYIPFIYLGYVFLVCIHAVTLARLGSPPR